MNDKDAPQDDGVNEVSADGCHFVTSRELNLELGRLMDDLEASLMSLSTPMPTKRPVQAFASLHRLQAPVVTTRHWRSPTSILRWAKS